MSDWGVCQRMALGILLYHSLPYSFKAGPLGDPEAGFLARLAVSKPQSSSSLYLLCHWCGRCMHSQVQHFTWVLGTRTQVLMFVLQALY